MLLLALLATVHDDFASGAPEQGAQVSSFRAEKLVSFIITRTTATNVSTADGRKRGRRRKVFPMVFDIFSGEWFGRRHHVICCSVGVVGRVVTEGSVCGDNVGGVQL